MQAKETRPVFARRVFCNSNLFYFVDGKLFPARRFGHRIIVKFDPEKFGFHIRAIQVFDDPTVRITDTLHRHLEFQFYHIPLIWLHMGRGYRPAWIAVFKDARPIIGRIAGIRIRPKRPAPDAGGGKSACNR